MCNLVAIKPLKLGGRFEEAILLSLLRLSKPSSAREIMDDLENNLDMKVSVGVLYTTLDRLIEKDFIDCWEQGPTGEPGIRSKHIFQATVNGKRAVSNIRDFNERAWKGVDIALVARNLSNDTASVRNFSS